MIMGQVKTKEKKNWDVMHHNWEKQNWNVMNELCHIWMSYVTHEWVMSHMNELCHIWMSYVTYECDIWMSNIWMRCVHMNELHMNELCHIWMSYISIIGQNRIELWCRIPPKNGRIALWSATNRWYVVKCVSQKQNWNVMQNTCIMRHNWWGL